MALRGSLKDFSLPDVFQLIQLSRKSGILRIKRPDAEGSIWFREGDVFFAQSNWRRELLGQRLVAGQKITPSALARALELRGAEPPGGRRLGQILVDEGYITQQTLEAFVQEQIQDTIFDIMRWDEGEFDFEVLPEVIQEDIGLSVSVENIVMEGSRRLEEWERIRKRVPSTDMVFRMSTAPGEGTFEISLKPSEWNLLLLVDGTRSVRDLAVATRHTDFEVARTVYGLFSAGLLEVAADAEVEERRTDRARREKARVGKGIVRIGHGREPGAATPSPGVPPTTEVVPADVPEPTTPPAAHATDEGLIYDTAPAGEVRAEHREVEVPEFLARGGEEPSVEDLATFEQVLEAVLAQAEAAPAAAETEVPAVSAGAAEPPEVEPSAPEPSAVASSALLEGDDAVSATLINLDVEEPAEAEAPLPTAEAPEVAPPAGEVSGVAQPAGGFARTGDFEADLRSLGLGELPEELLVGAPEITPEPAGGDEVEPGEIAQPASQGVPEVTGELWESPEIVVEAAAPSAEELIASLGPAEEVGEDDRLVLEEAAAGELPIKDVPEGPSGEVSEAVSEEGFEPPVPEAPYAARTEAREGVPVHAPEEAGPTAFAEAGEEVLAGAAEEAAPALGPAVEGVELEAPQLVSEEYVVTETYVVSEELTVVAAPSEEAGREAEADLEPTPTEAPTATPPVPSEEAGTGEAEGVTPTPSGVLFPTVGLGTEIGLGGGLGDELTALTGGGGRTRPAATVDRVPQAGERVTLHRDMMVDRDLLLQIIDGVERL